MAAGHQIGHGSTHDARPKAHIGGWHRFVTSTNHKDIGTMYFVFAIFAGLIIVFLSVKMRLQPFQLGIRTSGELLTFNYWFSGCGLIIAFFMLIPALIGGFGSWFVAPMIGAADMAFPRMHSIAFWLLPFSFALLVLSLFIEDSSRHTVVGNGLTIFGSPRRATDFAIVSLYIAGASTILGSVNFITTIFNMRAPGVTLRKMPLFVWSILVSTMLLLLWLSVSAAAVTLLLTERSSEINFASLAGGPEPITYQHTFWLLGHPEVYALILPSLGIISQVVSAFAKRPVFGDLALAYAFVAVSYVGFHVWTSQLCAGNLSTHLNSYFIFLTAVIGLLTCITSYSWLATMWGRMVTLRTPMLWAIGFFFLFMVRGVAGAVLATAGVDVTPKDAYSIMAHFHYVLSLGAIFAILAGWYYWFPRITGFLCNEALGKLHFWTTFIGVNFVFFARHFRDLAGMLSRYISYPERYERWNESGTVGSYITIAGLAVFLLCMMEAFIRRRVANQNPWKATTLEWTTS